MASEVLQLKHFIDARDLLQHDVDNTPRLTRSEFAGHLSELSSSGASALLTVAMTLVVDAHREGEPAAWISVGRDTFYAPDAARMGVDLDALAVIHAPDAIDAVSAAARLAHSGAFGIILVDLTCARGRPAPGSARARRRGRRARRGEKEPSARVWLEGEATRPLRVPTALLSRLVGLAHNHDQAVVLLTRKRSDAPSIDSLVSMQPLGDGRFSCTVESLKDKRRGPGWQCQLEVIGPPGVW